ncbi:RNA polymerase sigma factor (sigma-70 family) [Actinocrispum wychmicini]|uniref:RNA polymerase sigma factor (Sigma-70 family) n=2 Tax=Actinocrispum wychmicini TaxID=1213861 RepID=A0A4R2JBV5_9PSEU|nr:RNA polymerase sigma factor (sigma-70 family) [Actinocrispum wychmicini]
MEMDTTDLIARARAGDHNAFRDLVQGHSHELQVHCYRILGSLQDAEDALQETLVSAWRNLGGFGQRSSLRTWLYQIATNRCLSMLRADSRRPRAVPPLPEATLPEPTGAGNAPPPAMVEYRGIESAQRVFTAVSFFPAAPTAWYPPAPTS